MEATRTSLGLEIIKSDIFKDNRGFFIESWNKKKYEELGIYANFVQDNLSINSKLGVLRGLHYQEVPFRQCKLIQVLHGKIYDIVVNINKDSKDFGKWESHILDRDNQLFVDSNFAHGFQVISKNALVLYKVSNYYNKNAERTIIYNDKDLNIDWPIKKPIISEKDGKGIRFKDLCN